MAAAEIYSALDGVFKDVFQRSDIVLTPELSARDVPGWDSFRQIEIIIAVEERYGITLHTRELDSLNSVGDLVRILEARTRAP